MDYVSCLPQLLYRDGGFFEPQELLHDLFLNAPSPDRCRLIGELYPPFHSTRPMPDVLLTETPPFREELLNRYALFNRDWWRGAATAIVELTQVTLRASVLYLESRATFRTLYETHRANDRPYVPLIDAVALRTDCVDLSDPARLHVYLGSAGSHNYGHWLVDDLPRAKALRALGEAAAGRPIHLWITSFGAAMDQIRIETLQHVLQGLDAVEIGLLDLDRTYHFDILYYATPCSFHPLLKSPEALAFLAATVTPPLKGALPATNGSRIFVVRRSGRSRALRNIDHVERILAAHGFVTIDPEAMHFAEQAHTFAQADVIVGCMGAAMTNCLFARPGAQTLYFCPEGWTEPFYWDLAAARGHHYLACYGKLEDPAQPPHLSAYTIDPDAVEQMLARALGPADGVAADGRHP